MKKKGFLFLLLLTILLLTGCGQKAHIGICLAQKGTDFPEQLKNALQEAGYTVTVMDAGLDQAVQTQQIQSLTEACDLLITEPVMIQETATIAQLGKQTDVPVIFIGHSIEHTVLDSWKKLAYVGLPEETAGEVQGRLVAQLPECDLNGDGVIAYGVIAGPEDHIDAIARTDSCKAALGGLCLEVAYGAWSREAGEVNGRKLLATWGKDMEVVLCNSDELALGALDAIREGGRTVGQDIYLIGLGGDQQAQLLVRSGDFSGTVCPDWMVQKELLLTTVKKLLSDETVEKQQYGTYVPITVANVEDYIDD